MTGLLVESEDATVYLDDFYDNYAEVVIEYSVAPGYKAVLKEGAQLVSTFSAAQYRGSLDDISIVPEGQKAVKINFVYDNGTLEREPVTITINEDSNHEYNNSYTIENVPDGYTPTLLETTEGVSVSGNVISFAFTNDDFVELTIRFEGNNTTYTIKYYFEQLDGNYAQDLENHPDVKVNDAKVGTETEVVAPAVTGFSAEANDQQVVAAKDTVETVKY